MNAIRSARVIAGLWLVCCGGSGCAPKSASRIAKPRVELTMSVATSAQEVVETLSRSFNEQHKIAVRQNAGSSSALATQILRGAPVNVFLSADRAWAEKLQAEGKVREMVPLFSNRLVLVVPRVNAAHIHTPADLMARPTAKLALAGEVVPAGKYAEQALRKLELYSQLEQAGKIVRGADVRSALAYVARGEVEAGIVYATDLASAPEVQMVFEFDPTSHEEIVYVLVLLQSGEYLAESRQLFAYLQSPEAKRIYEQRGFTSVGTQPTS